MGRKWQSYGLAAGRRGLDFSARRLSFDPVSRSRLEGTGGWDRLGSRECGWFAPSDWRVDSPVCICVGAGEDVTFDLALADQYGAQVYIFDPTPRAVAHVDEAIRGHEGVQFRPWAVWNSDCLVEMFEPVDRSHVSHSIVNLQGTSRSFQAQGRSLPSILSEFNLEQVDLLKLDIEGAEYEVLEVAISSGCEIGIIEVEYDELSIPRKGFLRRVRQSVRYLQSMGYILVTVDRASDYVFVRKDYAARTIRHLRE